jgi:phospholipid-binding lipoprotein MlaA
MRVRRFAPPLLLAVIALGVAGGLRSARASEGSDPAPDSGLEEEQDPVLEDDEEDLLDEAGQRDPFEGFNRDVFSFNRGLDRLLFDPITRGYQFAVPAPGRRALYRAFQNMDSPVILANHMLQFRVVDAAGTTTRFVINSSLGVVGLFDPAADWFELYRREGDFGQTLARYGSPSGPFLMLPFFGPSTVRDVFGDVVDILADPLGYLMGPLTWWTIVLGGGEGLTTRDAHFDDLQALEAGSIDFYSALRSAYLQNRNALVREARAATAEWTSPPSSH